ncbi:unnamed protein product [Nyctereutes procyonoides]|uniref:(raccoon dog) hypothetical protein n=1 Tax=Nyctereutes procyonoides TaxID=34880 RepID=A0A811Z6M1_NYCPR|nr:unnamed protein product [Nyctereutes procyonoides]
MERRDLEAWLGNISVTCLSLRDWQKNETLDHLISLSGAWKKVISAHTEVSQTTCKNLSWYIDDSVQDALHWQLEDLEAFETSSLIGHSTRTYVLYYKDAFLCTRTGECIYGIQTHSGAAVRYDEQKLVTDSFDNTVACWERKAVFNIDYNDELDTLVNGSEDFTVEIRALSPGTSLNTLNGSFLHSPGDYIPPTEINCKCLKMLSVSEDRSICLQPGFQFDGRYIVTPEIANLALLGFRDIFALLFDNHSLYIVDLQTETEIKDRLKLPAGEASWLDGLDGHNDMGLVFATSMPDHTITWCCGRGMIDATSLPSLTDLGAEGVGFQCPLDGS